MIRFQQLMPLDLVADDQGRSQDFLRWSGPHWPGHKAGPSKFKKSSDFIHYFLEGAQINGKLVIKTKMKK